MDKPVWVSYTCLANSIMKEVSEKVNHMVPAGSVGPTKIFIQAMSVKEKRREQESTSARARLLSTKANGIKGIQVSAA
jgi:hypothetical protein